MASPAVASSGVQRAMRTPWRIARPSPSALVAVCLGDRDEPAEADPLRPSTSLHSKPIPGIHTKYAKPENPHMSVPYALLALLREGPKYGLRLQSEFQSRTGEVWPLNVGQVYTTLQRLERDGLVESDGEGERSQKRYRIT